MPATTAVIGRREPDVMLICRNDGSRPSTLNFQSVEDQATPS
jgi:hypothetical protein